MAEEQDQERERKANLMEATVSGRDFYKAVSKLKFVRGSTHVSAIWVDVGGGAFTVRASNYDMWVEAIVPVLDHSDGDYRKPFAYNRMMGIATSLQKVESVNISTSDGGITMTFDGTEVFIKASHEENWPSADIPSPLLDHVVDNILLESRAIAEVLPFASRDRGRPILNGIGIRDGHYACTDSYRLAHVYIPNSSTEHEFILGAGAARFIADHFSGQVPLTVGGGKLWAAKEGDFRLCSSLSQGAFPCYEKLIPTIAESEMSLACSDGFIEAARKLHSLHKSLKFSSYTPVQVSNANDTHVRLSIGEDGSRCVHCVPGQVHRTVAFNVAYLLDMFNGTNVDSLFGTGSMKPWGIQEEIPEFAGAYRERVIMPARADG